MTRSAFSFGNRRDEAADARTIRDCLRELAGCNAALEQLQQLKRAADTVKARLNAFRESEELRKKRAAEQHEAEGLREALRKAQSFRTERSFAKLNWRDRWEFERAESACIKSLAAIEAVQRTTRRRDLRSGTAKHRQAMVGRGVTFDRMMVG